MRVVDVPEFRPRRNLATCTPETTASEAAKIMGERNIGGIPIVNGDTLVGIFTERDLVNGWSPPAVTPRPPGSAR